MLSIGVSLRKPAVKVELNRWFDQSHRADICELKKNRTSPARGLNVSTNNQQTLLQLHFFWYAWSSGWIKPEQKSYVSHAIVVCHDFLIQCTALCQFAGWFCRGKICLFCYMTSIGRLEIRIHHIPSMICDFHCPVDFRLDIIFPHIFWFLHQNRVGIGGFTLTKHRSVGDEEKTIPSCLDTSSLMIAPPVLPQSAFCAQKKQIGRSYIVSSFWF